MGIPPHRPALTAALAALALGGGLAACAPEPEAPPVGPSVVETPDPGPSPSSSSSEPNDDAESGVIAEGLEAPWSIAFYGDVPIVSERDSARLLELAHGTAREIATVADVASGGEGGLLGLATRDGWLYVYSTAADGNRVQRSELSGEAGTLALGPAETVLDGIPAARNHNGGRIAFGPDGMLYVTTGDAGDRPSAQDTDSLSGKILRLTPGGAVPEDNPIPGSAVYSYGHRNPQGLAWTADGVLYASEFGQDTWDELNRIEPGVNYGWPEVEGIAGTEGFLDPIVAWPPSEASPSGMVIVDGVAYLANLRGERLRAVPLDDPTATQEYLVGELGRIRDVVRAPDGALWLVTNNTDGRGTPRDGDDRIVAIEVS